MQVYQRLKALNDVDGNPRRLYIVYDLNVEDHAQIWAVYDEGYKGKPRELEGMVELPSVDISSQEYRDYLRKDNYWKVIPS